MFRATNGKALVWGQAPTKITARYTTGNGSQKTSLLLASGKMLAHRKCTEVPCSCSTCCSPAALGKLGVGGYLKLTCSHLMGVVKRAWAPACRLVGPSAALSLPARDPGCAFLEPARRLCPGPALLLRRLPHPVADRQGIQGRCALLVEVWDVLAAVHKGSAVQDDPLRVLSGRRGLWGCLCSLGDRHTCDEERFHRHC